MLLLLISFIAGVLTILAPCILPLLPVIVGHSITDTTPSKRRLFVVVISLALSVILFTLILKASSLLIDIPQDFWKWISGGIIFIFGVTMVFPSIWEKFSFANTISLKSNKVMSSGYQKNSIWGDVIIGASLGPIFSACSPTYFVILATILPVSPILGLVYLLTYVFGLSLALVSIALLGQSIMAKVGKVSDPRGWFKKIFGIIFIIVAIGIVSGYDKKLQIDLLNSGFLDVTKIEQKLLEKNDKKDVNINDISNTNENIDENIEAGNKAGDTSTTKEMSFLNLTQKEKKYKLAPDISSPDGFINTNGKPITIAEFKGKKVVLLDIWTYSCINCQRTIPYLNDWYKKYEDEGLVIIGLHTPEFAFEKVQKNVEDSVKDFDIKYPVVLDNDFSTWNAFENRYWPRKYLIDIDGYIVYDHAGEGAYEETEKAIQKALSERATILNSGEVSGGTIKPKDIIKMDSSKVKSPEIYFGSSRNEYLANGNKNTNGVQKLSTPEKILLNNLYLSGTWNFSLEYAETSETSAKIIYKYNAKDLYFVASSTNGATVKILLDGKPITLGKGEDVKANSTVSIKENRLYKIVQGVDYGEHTIEIQLQSGTLDAYTFTFG